MESLVVHLEQVDAPRQPWERTLPAAWLAEQVYAAAPPWQAAGDVAFRALLTKLGGASLLVEGKATAALRSDCRRCLRAVSSEIPLVFTLQLVRRPPQKAAAEESRKGRRGRTADKQAREEDDDEQGDTFDENDADLEFFDGDHVDLAPIIREQLLLALPATEPLCREGCKGLCSTCGQDLNDKDCGHSQRVPDPRWSALKDIKV